MLAKVTQEDADLLERYTTHGDRAAFNELSTRYRNLIVDTARRVIGNNHDAEDVAQLVLLELARDAKTIKSYVPGWLRTVTIRRAYRWRKESIRRSLAEAIAAEGRDNDSSRSEKEFALVVRMSIDELPDSLRIPFKLRYFENRSHSHIAGLMGIDRGRVKYLIGQAISRLSSTLSSYGLPITVPALVLYLNEPSATSAAEWNDHPSTNPSATPVSPGPAAARSALAPAILSSKWLWPMAIAVLAALSTLALTSGPAGWPSPFARTSAFDMLSESYAPHADLRDPLGFRAKISDMTRSPADFWRGSKVPFLRWCRDNAADWLASRDTLVLSPGRIDPASIGWYPTSTNLPTHDIALLDTFDTARIPFQLQLLEGWIALRILAQQNGIAITGESETLLAHAYFETYTATYLRTPHAPEPDTLRQTALSLLGPAPTHSSPTTPSPSSVPAMQRAEEFARAVEKTSRQSALLRSALRVDVADAALPHIISVVRVRSSTAGLRDYHVLLRKPFKSSDQNAILVFRKHIPSAAEREGIYSEIRSGEPARQATETAKAIRHPQPLLASWCELADGQYEIATLETADSRLDPATVTTFAQLTRTATLLAHLTAQSHRTGQDTPYLKSELTDTLFTSIRTRGNAYLIHLNSEFLRFTTDPSTLKAATQE